MLRLTQDPLGRFIGPPGLTTMFVLCLLTAPAGLESHDVSWRLLRPLLGHALTADGRSEVELTYINTCSMNIMMFWPPRGTSVIYRRDRIWVVHRTATVSPEGESTNVDEQEGEL